MLTVKRSPSVTATRSISLGGSSRSGRELISSAVSCASSASEHGVVVELRLRAAAPGEQPAGAVAEHVDLRVRDRVDHAPRHRVLVHAQLRVHARDDDVDAGEHVVVVVERAVVEDVDLDAGQDPERCQLLVQRGDDVELLEQPLA